MRIYKIANFQNGELNLENYDFIPDVGVRKFENAASQTRDKLESLGCKLDIEYKIGKESNNVVFTLIIPKTSYKHWMSDSIIKCVSELTNTPYGKIRSSCTISSNTIYPDSVMKDIRNRTRTWEDLTEEEKNKGIILQKLFFQEFSNN
jgi:hypothetical protein